MDDFDEFEQVFGFDLVNRHLKRAKHEIRLLDPLEIYDDLEFRRRFWITKNSARNLSETFKYIKQ